MRRTVALALPLLPIELLVSANDFDDLLDVAIDVVFHGSDLEMIRVFAAEVSCKFPDFLWPRC